jgi:uncharacterized protein (DUF169 family)
MLPVLHKKIVFRNREEERMKPLTLDLSIFNQLELERPPVGVKFLFDAPPGIPRLAKKVAFCEMLKEAQLSGEPFYTDKENHDCEPANYLFGYDLPPLVESGGLGVALGAFKEARANRRIYDVLPRLNKGTVNYTVFAPINKLSFDPDLLIILTDKTSQTEIILRSLSYTTGQVLTSRMTNVLGCAWLYMYPYKSGELNYLTTGLGWGMKAHKAFPEGRQLISVPFDLLPTITQNLREMPFVPKSFTEESQAAERAAFKSVGL